MAKDREELLAHGPNQEPAAPPRVSRGQQRRRQRSVFQYVTILFAAALVLLFYTFMMERRQFELKQEEDQANLSNLQQQSVSAVQRLEGLITENEQLKEQLEDQENQLKDLQNRLDQLEAEYSAAEQTIIAQSRTAEAMDWFWQIDEAYVRGKYSLCRSLIQDMGDLLAGCLPEYSVTSNGRFSPAERYQEICEKVMK